MNIEKKVRKSTIGAWNDLKAVAKSRGWQPGRTVEVTGGKGRVVMVRKELVALLADEDSLTRKAIEEKHGVSLWFPLWIPGCLSTGRMRIVPRQYERKVGVNFTGERWVETVKEEICYSR